LQTGVPDYSRGSCHIYPNPMREEAVIEFPASETIPYRLVIRDPGGKAVMVKENIRYGKYTLVRDNLKPGIYIIELIGDRTYRGRLMVE